MLGEAELLRPVDLHGGELADPEGCIAGLLHLPHVLGFRTPLRDQHLL